MKRHLRFLLFCLLAIIFNLSHVYSQGLNGFEIGSGDDIGIGTSTSLSLPLSGDLTITPPVHFLYNSPTLIDTSIQDPGGGIHTQGMPITMPIRMLTLTGSSVGIGTTTPSSTKKLHVGGDVLFEGRLCVGAPSTNFYVSPNIKLLIGSDWAFTYNSDEKIIGNNCRFGGFANVEGSSRIADGTTSAIFMNNNGSMHFCTAPYGSGAITWNRMTMTNDGKVGIGTETPLQKFHVEGNSYITGNVGIGTSNPQKKLHVVGDSYLNGKVGIGAENPLTKMQIGDIWTFHDGVGDKIIGRNCYYNGSDNVRIQQGVASRIYFGNSGDIVMQTSISGNANSVIDGAWNTVIMKNNGSVGIGISNTFDYKLAVNGTIGCKKVVVETTSTWPDYVFSKDYSLKNLDEVAAFIEENNHLPEVPSAVDISEKGIDLAEMNVILLKKVEELTLYIIEQNRRIEALENNLER